MVSRAVRHRFARLLLGSLALLGLTACTIDSQRVAVCQRLLAAFEPEADQVRVLAVVREGVDSRAAFTVQYRVGEDPTEHWISCRFGSSAAGDRFYLTEVATDRTGDLTEIGLHMVRLWMRLHDQGVTDPNSLWHRPPGADATASVPPAGPGAETARDRSLFLLQQIINALVMSCVYGLLAVAYTLIYGVVGRINLAVGDLSMLGAFLTVVMVILLSMVGLDGSAAALLTVLVFAGILTAAPAWGSDRWLFRPIREAGTQAPLIATLGLSIAMQEGVRLLHGAKDRWLPPVFHESFLIAVSEHFSVHLLLSQMVIGILTLGLYGGLLLLLARTAYGRCLRACNDDRATAALLGVDVDRTVATTFAVAGVCAAVAGFFVALHYGGVNFSMGFLVGFKALTAAVVGGIGVVPGAMVGGAAVALLETFWSAYLSPATKDIAVFVLLTLFLMFRPQGILGAAVPWAARRW